MPPDDVHQLPTSVDVFPADQEFVISRVLAAPPTMVFAAWTRPGFLSRWWGPEGFTVPVARTDLRPGGAYRLVMRSPQGADYPLKGIYQEVVEPERLVMTVDVRDHPREWHELLRSYRRDNEAQPAPEMVWFVTFEPENGATRLTISARFASRDEHDAMLRMGMAEGWNQSLDRLARLLKHDA